MADAGDVGNGGTIILWADNNAYSRGQFYARGGKNSGNGGFVETSSPNILDVDGTIVNTLAPFGNAGDWLLDPTNITIGTSGVAYNPANHSSALPAGNVIIDANTINAALSNVILTATSNITFAANVAMTNNGVGFRANAGNDILINNNTLTTRRGVISLNAGHDIDIRNSTVDSNGATITLDAGNNILTRSVLFQPDGAAISLHADEDIDSGANSNFSTSGGDVTFRADEEMKLSGTTINTTGGAGSRSIAVRDDNDSIIIPSELGNGNTFVSGGGGGDIVISADNILNNQNNNCFKAGGSSSSCTSIVANPIAITITADAKTKVYGSSDPLLTYFLSTTLASGSTVTGALTRAVGENVGTYAINRGSLDIFGTTAYNITYVSNSLTITQKTLNILADAVTKVYGAADPALTYTSTGLVTGDSFTGALTRDTGENAGTYAINQGTLTAGDNYIVNYTGADFTITRAVLKILADAKSKTYGASDPALTYAIEDLVNGDDESIVTGALTRDAGENVGLYEIGQGTVTASDNYTIDYVGNDLTITPKSLTVRADDKSKIYGSTDPLLTYTFDGLINGDSEDAFDISIARSLDENVGRYKIFLQNNAEQALQLFNEGPILEEPEFDVTQNYDINFESGTFSITPKSLLIRADNKTKIFGAVDPLLTYTFDGIVNGDESGNWSDIGVERDPGEAVGNYDITLNFVKPEFDDGVFSITQTLPTTPGIAFGLLPTSPLGALGRPIISLADRLLNPNTFFLPFIVSGLNTDVGLLASGGNVPAGAPTATNLANIAPDAGDEGDAPQDNNTEQQNQSGGSDIDCANSFLDNKPCQDASI